MKNESTRAENRGFGQLRLKDAHGHNKFAHERMHGMQDAALYWNSVVFSFDPHFSSESCLILDFLSMILVDYLIFSTGWTDHARMNAV